MKNLNLKKKNLNLFFFFLCFYFNIYFILTSFHFICYFFSFFLFNSVAFVGRGEEGGRVATKTLCQTVKLDENIKKNFHLLYCFFFFFFFFFLFTFI